MSKVNKEKVGRLDILSYFLWFLRLSRTVRVHMRIHDMCFALVPAARARREGTGFKMEVVVATRLD